MVKEFRYPFPWNCTFRFLTVYYFSISYFSFLVVFPPFYVHWLVSISAFLLAFSTPLVLFALLSLGSYGFQPFLIFFNTSLWDDSVTWPTAEGLLEALQKFCLSCLNMGLSTYECFDTYTFSCEDISLSSISIICRYIWAEACILRSSWCNRPTTL